MAKKNVYYEVLGWGNKHMNTGVSFEELKKFLSENPETSISDKRAKALFRELFTPANGVSTPAFVDRAIDDGSKFHLTVEAAFRHIEIQEIEEARQSSRCAMIVAIIAIVIGALVGIAQILIALYN